MLDLHHIHAAAFGNALHGAAAGGVYAGFRREREHARVGDGDGDVFVGDDAARFHFRKGALVGQGGGRLFRHQAAEKGVDGALRPKQVGEQNARAQGAHRNELAQKQLAV